MTHAAASISLEVSRQRELAAEPDDPVPIDQHGSVVTDGVGVEDAF